ncbi:SDR family NAD(P)-dependent oxidoreductase [Burkholderia pyrrocinia]|uniref:SDR family NAD(P)-dependent oxidoreductase n=1 Tax=Burkholderia pyrrocinia TaxID=60550 RepID=UPI00137511EE|nr:glucose 1-dehydrogenase [Burkholderia pyrrocinia]
MTLIEKLSLKGKVALVTGGAGGIGQAIAKELLALGATVVLSDRVAAAAEATRDLEAEPSKLDFVSFDVADSQAVAKGVGEIVAKHGRLDILVANAGVSYDETTLEHTDESWRRVMGVNLDGVFFCIREAGRAMAKAGGGSIVAISSICGVTAVRPEVHIGYDVSKAGVAHMCRNLAVEWAKRNIRVNAVSPAYAETAMLQAVGEENPAVMKQWLEDMPIGRLMKPGEVASAVAFLASDAASGISGHNLLVDGAYSVS